MAHPTTPHLPTQWNERLPFDLALALEGSGEPLADVLKRHGISSQKLVDFTKDPIFQARVEAYRDEIRTKGVTFKLKARAQAEELLTSSWILIHDPHVPASVKADLIKSTVKWAGLEPKANEDINTGGSTSGVNIQINLGGQTATLSVNPNDPSEGSREAYQEPDKAPTIEGKFTFNLDAANTPSEPHPANILDAQPDTTPQHLPVSPMPFRKRGFLADVFGDGPVPAGSPA